MNYAFTSSPSPSLGSSIGFEFSSSYFFIIFVKMAPAHGFLGLLGLFWLLGFLFGRFFGLREGELFFLGFGGGCLSRGSAKMLQ
jgi:hypothetical protein